MTSRWIIILPMVVSMFLFRPGVYGSIDEEIADAADNKSELEYFYDESTNMMMMEYDIQLSFDEYNALQAEDDDSEPGQRKKRAAGLKGKFWPNKVVNYEYAYSFSGKELGEIQRAMKHWEKYTCLRFVQNRGAKNRIVIQDGRGCSSRVGMAGGEQALRLSRKCRKTDIVIHEIGHALGLMHEQTRPDRDNYVTIHERNIVPGMSYNFKKIPWTDLHNFGVPYDYMSIMHYGKRFFSVNRRTTIEAKDPAFRDKIGTAYVLSFLDIKTVNLMYNCKRHISSCTKNDNECPGNGFVGKDCQCWCPHEMNTKKDAIPVKRCSSRPKPTAPPKPKPSECRDSHTSCSFWAGKGECKANPKYMLKSCKRSCNTCDTGVVIPVTSKPVTNKPVTSKPVTTTCQDNHVACGKWLKMGYCTRRYEKMVRPRCPKSCGICTTPGGTCKDHHVACDEWFRKGYCTKEYVEVVRPKCPMSCGICKANIGGEGSSSCKDTHVACGEWKQKGYCVAQYKEVVRPQCPKSCGIC